jgi:hypothetical protein
MRTSGSKEILAGALNDLNKKWQNTGSAWRDKARSEFEKDYLDEIQMTVKNSQAAMAAIDELLRQVMRDCS